MHRLDLTRRAGVTADVEHLTLHHVRLDGGELTRGRHEPVGGQRNFENRAPRPRGCQIAGKNAHGPGCRVIEPSGHHGGHARTAPPDLIAIHPVVVRQQIPLQ